MKHTNNWQVTAEMSPEPNFADVGEMSPDQKVAFETWVNTAINMLNRDKTDMEVLAQLSHDGCPDPETVLIRAKEQPSMEDAQPNEQDLAGVTPQPDIYTPEGQTGDVPRVESSRLVPEVTLSRVIVAGMPATEIGRYEIYGQELVRVSFDNGDEHDVPANQVEAAPDAGSKSVTEIQSFIDSFPEVNEFNVQAHISKWREVVAACACSVPDAKDDTERAQLGDLHSKAKQKLVELGDIQHKNANDERYLDEQPRFEIKTVAASNFTGGRDAGGDGWMINEAALSEAAIDSEKAVREGAAIWVSELHPAIIDDAQIVRESAISYLPTLVGRKVAAETQDAFLASVEKHRVERLAGEEVGDLKEGDRVKRPQHREGDPLGTVDAIDPEKDHPVKVMWDAATDKLPFSQTADENPEAQPDWHKAEELRLHSPKSSKTASVELPDLPDESLFL